MRGGKKGNFTEPYFAVNWHNYNNITPMEIVQ